MGGCGCTWVGVAIHGWVWPSMGGCGHPWVGVAVHGGCGCPWVSVAGHPRMGVVGLVTILPITGVVISRMSY